MSSSDNPGNNNLEKIYLEASQWVRLANTVIWSMGTLLIPLSFGFVGLALNKSDATEFTLFGKVLLGVGSVFLFSFWVYASFLYTSTSVAARKVLAAIEKKWTKDVEMSFYRKQNAVVLKRFPSLPYAQLASLVVLIVVWFWILCYQQ